MPLHLAWRHLYYNHLAPGLLRWVADPAAPDAVLTLAPGFCMLLTLCSLHEHMYGEDCWQQYGQAVDERTT